MAFHIAMIPLGALTALASWELYDHFHKASVQDKLKDQASQYTFHGPSGETVFNQDAAGTILQQLGGMVYTYPDTDRSKIKVSPEPQGMPVAPELSATQWLTLQNKTLSILAPLYMAVPTSASTERFLRAVPPGQENLEGYGVILYAGTLDKNATPPGSPATRGQSPAPRLAHTPLSLAHDEAPNADLYKRFQALILGGQDPIKLRHAAIALERSGLKRMASALRAKASNIELAPGMPRRRPRPPTGRRPWSWPSWLQTRPSALTSTSPAATPSEPSNVVPLTPRRRPAQAATTPAFYTQPSATPAATVPSGTGPETFISPSARSPKAPMPTGKAVHLSSARVSPSLHVPVTAAPAGWQLPVKDVQANLIILGMLPATDPATGKKTYDGVRGQTTDKAIRSFQTKNGLAADGVVDGATAQALHVSASEYASQVTTAAPSVSHHTLLPHAAEVLRIAGKPIGDGPTSTPPGWKADIRSIQKLLVLAKLLPDSQVTGMLDPATKSAVSKFQISYGLAPDGIVGGKTLAALNDFSAHPAVTREAVASAAKNATSSTSGLITYSPFRSTRLNIAL